MAPNLERAANYPASKERRFQPVLEIPYLSASSDCDQAGEFRNLLANYPTQQVAHRPPVFDSKFISRVNKYNFSPPF
jgi:hypothetical protein